VNRLAEESQVGCEGWAMENGPIFFTNLPAKKAVIDIYNYL
jgi:hypothetical protein